MTHPETCACDACLPGLSVRLLRASFVRNRRARVVANRKAKLDQALREAFGIYR